MPGTEYVLVGFGGFLERRRVAFVEPLPNNRVCAVCGMVENRSFLLPCCHVVCDSCRILISCESGTCPLDNTKSAEDDDILMTFENSQLEQRRVLCIAGGEKCDFTGTLSELKEHLLECYSDEVKCFKCQRHMRRFDLFEHFRQCSSEAFQGSPVSSSAVGSTADKLGAMKTDRQMVRECVTSRNVDHNVFMSEATSIVERIACITSQLADVEEQARDEQDGSVIPIAKKVTYTPGPYRAASKLGAFIEFYPFVDAYGAYNSLTGDKKEHLQSHGTHISAGYAFELQFQCRKQEDGEVLVSFTLTLHESIWDALLEWPFAKKVTIILTHPEDLEKDIRMLVSANSEDMVRRPVHGAANRGFQTETVNWRDLELQGFILNNYIYVNVELE
ncbi:hypothetical protein V5799_029095 [Amblyomma americanum]|uniref:RING-type domain-containing protein n=1 Tax=Amblyomma americanum TaxID=6943 RepID=A0AAQ4ES58_AMBAM